MASPDYPVFNPDQAPFAFGPIAAPQEPPSRQESAGRKRLRSAALREARGWTPGPRRERPELLQEICRTAAVAIRGACQQCQELKARGAQLSGGAQSLLEHSFLLSASLRESGHGIRAARNLPEVQTADGERAPRAYAASRGFLKAVRYRFDAGRLAAFLEVIQQESPLENAELWAVKSFLQLVLLSCIGRIAATLRSGEQSPAGAEETVAGGGEPSVDDLLASLFLLRELEWREQVEELSATDKTLREDPSGTYAQMDPESRDDYLGALADMAAHSKWEECAIARKAVEMARAAKQAPPWNRRAQERRCHVGYYLVGEGRKALQEEIQYRPSWGTRVREWITHWPLGFYLGGIGICTVAAMAVVLCYAPDAGLATVAFGALFLFPAAECAVGVVNQLATILARPKRLPKLDFSSGIPAGCSTMVVVPTLLIGEEQVRQAVADMEIRYLANRDANLYFAILSDLPDSSQSSDEKDALAELCARLIRDLNHKHARSLEGPFFLFHRDRAYNQAEERWMGWERKRGKLLDFNRLLLGEFDAFPVKVGDLAVLPRIRYVITLDLDTQLPRDSAHKLVGALAHPLNRAVIDPLTNRVVEGYAIVQPRIVISVESAHRSRLAAFFSGDTGLDIYTRAVSDVYQDLFGEGTYTGKGIYEVETFHEVLGRRFPCNALLSHDLIEGAYARTGLATDVEVIDDYPSHFSAFSRRRHRWIRGDWQIVRWLFSRVPNYYGQKVRNPVSLISRWKIADNLRRSLTEPATFLLLVTAWALRRDAAIYWTLVALAALALPIYFQLGLSLMRAGRTLFSGAFCKNVGSSFMREQTRLYLRIALLCQQSLAALDAIGRSCVRMTFTRKRLLEWETAAEAELGVRHNNPVDAYLQYTPVLAVAIGLVLWALHRLPAAVALPLLGAWALSPLICRWLDKPRAAGNRKISGEDQAFLRQAALRTWRFFREFGGADENWLIPDTVQTQASLCAHRISPTNLGFLLSSRLAAYDLGFLTISELAAMTEKTFGTMDQMEKCRGHFYNWYDTLTLEPSTPLFVSTVDSGNLLCCLWALKQGCLEAGKQPLFREVLGQGLQDCLALIGEFVANGSGNPSAAASLRRINGLIGSASAARPEWWRALADPSLEPEILSLKNNLAGDGGNAEAAWWANELVIRVSKLRQMIFDFAPWLLPQFAQYWSCSAVDDPVRIAHLTLESAPAVQAEAESQLAEYLESAQTGEEARLALQSLRSLLARSSYHSRNLARRLAAIAAAAGDYAENMDFAFLYNREKKLLSIGYEVQASRCSACHYDLLSSEARAAFFAAIAKGDIPQRSWFQLDRSTTRCEGVDALLSWSGTMFEYLLPSVWMESYAGTLLDRNARAAIRIQQKFMRTNSMPWGVSEAASGETPEGSYGYRAFGIPGLALDPELSHKIVIAPYATFLSLHFDPLGAVKNLKRMRDMGWLSAYGFYEAADFPPGHLLQGERWQIAQCWMAHHQGMSLASVSNAVCGSAMQRHFHAEPTVRATKRLLHEKYRSTSAISVRVEPMAIPPQRPALLPRLAPGGARVFKSPASVRSGA